ncbi:MAG: class I SAM-dependent methyltransferase, partial [Candidatus Riflebacteria bacterium]
MKNIKAFNSPFLPANPLQLSVQEGYDLWSEIYDQEDNVLIALEERFLQPLIRAGEFKEILDCGCGTGRMSIWLQKSFPQAVVTGVDFSAGMLKQAKQKDDTGRIKWQVADLNQPFPLPDRKFDLVVSTLVVEHIRDLNNYFSEMRRVATDDAPIFVTGLHPAMHLFGISARFTHPETGKNIMPASECHDIAAMVTHAIEAGLSL